ncbi:hypothetical protein [Candidatus Chloroploca asiatica]|uniref:VWFA domain-containing protein n=1 Tax=Candidatus Chloroploca asiatica TaxID=1506545 RepID=A0A2H3KQB1_9CHLR|nr:hypothetical protein [Candidatus Chloroploca asiatica]PDW00556.1 hypothetical protein A9Q02_09185 [Candidatus Chloroploca asiatica]
MILYLHDGVPTDEPPTMVAATVAMVRRQGTLVVGVSVGPQEHLERLEGIFGAADTLAVARLREVPPALGRVLQRAAATPTQAALSTQRSSAVMFHRVHAPPLLTARARA